MSNYRHAACSHNPRNSFLQGRPPMRHVAWLTFTQIVFEHIRHGDTCTYFHQITSKMGARNQVRIANVLQGSFVYIWDSGAGREIMRHITSTALSARTRFLKAFDQIKIILINIEADNMNCFTRPCNRNLDTRDKTQPQLRCRCARLSNTTYFIMICERPYVDAIFFGSRSKDRRCQNSIRNSGVAMKVNIEG